MNGMKNIFLTLALIAGVALAVPASLLRRDVSALSPPEPAPKVETPEVPAKVEEAPQAESKQAASTTLRPTTASNPEVMKPAEGNVEEVTFLLPISDESAPGMVYEARDPTGEEFVAAIRPEQFDEEMQGDGPARNAFEAIQETQWNADAKTEEAIKETKEAKETKGAKEAKESVKAAEPKKAGDEKSVEAVEKSETVEETAEAEEEREIFLVSKVAEAVGKEEEIKGAEKTQEAGKKEEGKKVEEVKEAKQAEEVKDVKEAKEAKEAVKVEGKKEPESDVALEEKLLQAQSADNQREKMIDDMIEKLKKLKGSPQAN